MPLNAAEFRRRSEELFASSYLTSLGVIQSIALGGLILRMAETKESVLLYLQAFAVLCAILLVVTEYSWWILIMRTTPRFPDVAFPYMLGFLEYAAILKMGELSHWWFVLMSALGIAAIITRFYVRAQCKPKYFERCEWLRPITLRNLDVGSWLIAVMVFYFAWMTIFSRTLSTFWTVITFVILYGLMTAMTVVSSQFLTFVKERFENEG